jgi:hypothetical protein
MTAAANGLRILGLGETKTTGMGEKNKQINKTKKTDKNKLQ